LKLLQETTGKTLEEISRGNDFLSRLPITKNVRERIDKQDCNKFKNSCKVNNCQNQEINYRMGEKYLPVIHQSINPDNVKSSKIKTPKPPKKSN
jgi:hypothetical protein